MGVLSDSAILHSMIERIIAVVMVGVILVCVSIFSGQIFAHGLGIAKVARDKVLLGSITLPFVYILNLVAIRASNSWFMSSIYLIVNIIGGVVFYLFIGAILLAVILSLGYITKITIPHSVSLFILFGAISLSIVGFIQSRIIKTVSYEVTIPHLPPNWEGKRALLVSDTHFSVINSKRFSKQVVERIKKEYPDIILHAGDFYDGPKIVLPPITAPWKELASQYPVFYAPGNHEGYGDYTAFIKSIKETGAVVLEDTVVTHDGVHIAGLRYRDKRARKETDAVLSRLPLDTSTATILINHLPTFQEEISKYPIHLMVLGHTHNGQFWPVNYLVKRIYGKYTYGLQKDETLSTITTSGVGTFGPPLRLFNTPELVIITFRTK